MNCQGKMLFHQGIVREFWTDSNVATILGFFVSKFATSFANNVMDQLPKWFQNQLDTKRYWFLRTANSLYVYLYI